METLSGNLSRDDAKIPQVDHTKAVLDQLQGKHSSRSMKTLYSNAFKVDKHNKMAVGTLSLEFAADMSAVYKRLQHTGAEVYLSFSQSFLYEGSP